MTRSIRTEELSDGRSEATKGRGNGAMSLVSPHPIPYPFPSSSSPPARTLRDETGRERYGKRCSETTDDGQRQRQADRSLSFRPFPPPYRSPQLVGCSSPYVVSPPPRLRLTERSEVGRDKARMRRGDERKGGPLHVTHMSFGAVSCPSVRYASRTEREEKERDRGRDTTQGPNGKNGDTGVTDRHMPFLATSGSSHPITPIHPVPSPLRGAEGGEPE